MMRKILKKHSCGVRIASILTERKLSLEKSIQKRYAQRLADCARIFFRFIRIRHSCRKAFQHCRRDHHFCRESHLRRSARGTQHHGGMRPIHRVISRNGSHAAYHQHALWADGHFPLPEARRHIQHAAPDAHLLWHHG